MFTHFDRRQLNRIEQGLAAISSKLGLIQKEETQMALTMQDILAKQKAALATATNDLTLDTAIKTAFDAQTQLIVDLKAQLQALIDAGADPAKLQELSDSMDELIAAQSADNAAKAILAGTPPGTGQL